MSPSELNFCDWRGSAYDIGFQHGRTLHEKIRFECDPALRTAARTVGLTIKDHLLRFRDSYLPWFERYTHRAIEEVRGLADGGGFCFPYAFFAAARDGARPARLVDEGCTAFYCAPRTTHDNDPLIGQNKDANAPLDRYHVMRRVYDDGGATLTLNYPGWLTNIGINSYRLAWTGNALYAESSEHDTVPYSLLRAVIAESRSIQEVLAIAHELPIDTCCMMVADADGHGVCVESAKGRVAIQNLDDQVFGHANSVVLNPLQPYAHAKPASPSSPFRQRNMQRLLDDAAGSISVGTIRQILRDHTDSPRGICLHPAPDDPFVTTASVIAEPAKRRMHVAIGQPCASPYRIYEI